jgi:hypothetical protein
VAGSSALDVSLRPAKLLLQPVLGLAWTPVPGRALAPVLVCTARESRRGNVQGFGLLQGIRRVTDCRLPLLVPHQHPAEQRDFESPLEALDSVTQG